MFAFSGNVAINDALHKKVKTNYLDRHVLEQFRDVIVLGGNRYAAWCSQGSGRRIGVKTLRNLILSQVVYVTLGDDISVENRSHNFSLYVTWSEERRTTVLLVL
jgi:hypothetical protein